MIYKSKYKMNQGKLNGAISKLIYMNTQIEAQGSKKEWRCTDEQAKPDKNEVSETERSQKMVGENDRLRDR